ncbi:hypothetical protein, partial [Paenibacillus phoenicis]|uniref:hypothetical protein n=1 Tax=Paenibacillus phoenicis TaxID=554117 RepID=UPI003D2A6D6B
TGFRNSGYMCMAVGCLDFNSPVMYAIPAKMQFFEVKSPLCAKCLQKCRLFAPNCPICPKS